MTRAMAVLALLSLMQVACYRTHYANFSGQNPERATEQSYLPIRESGWQSFFVYGWAPGEKRIDAVKLCGGTENVHSIQTRRTFLQGLVAAFAGYNLVNIYSQYDGAVYCHGSLEERRQETDLTPFD